jgi:hypothetical protein
MFLSISVILFTLPAGLTRRVGTSLEVAANRGPIAEKLTTIFNKVRARDIYRMPVKELQRIFFAAGKEFRALGFDEAAGQVDRNAKMLSRCPSFNRGVSIDECLRDEEGKHILQDKTKGTPAELADNTPSMGLIWSSRILGFMAEMFDKAGSDGSFYEAACSAYEHRIKPAFKKCTFCVDNMVDKVVFHALASGLSGHDGDKYFELFGGKNVAMREMREFARVALPIADGVFAALVDHGLDMSTNQ